MLAPRRDKEPAGRCYSVRLWPQFTVEAASKAVRMRLTVVIEGGRDPADSRPSATRVLV